MSKFAATYFINKCLDGDDGDFSYELLDLHVMFDNIYEEQALVGEFTPTYDEVTYEILKEHPFGIYSVFIIGDITYSTDYYGESDVYVEIDYHVVRELPNEYGEFELLGDSD